MPKEPSFTADQLAERAMHEFWRHGYYATGLDSLVRATKVSRHGIYTTFGGKARLFEACFERYQTLVVTPAFGVVEGPGANLGSVAAYFETQIALAEAGGLPGPGCLVANTATEVAPHDDAVLAQVTAHNERLRGGFFNALCGERAPRSQVTDAECRRLAQICVIFTNGLWSSSRLVADGDELRNAVASFLSLLKEHVR